MSDTPSARIVAAAVEPQTVTDALGRVLVVRKLDTLARFDLSGAVGPDAVANPVQFGMAVIAACVTEIDGVPVPFPRNMDQVRKALQKLGDEGLNAAGAALSPAVPAADE